ncbi:MAG TPA: hypothetical protein VF522_13360 [Ramlibacter sp.]|uniref:hypothetical protein n=1 Tax=Ramlibacter sp. TaxID=1917967 RepID=UPI002ED535B4
MPKPPPSQSTDAFADTVPMVLPGEESGFAETMPLPLPLANVRPAKPRVPPPADDDLLND